VHFIPETGELVFSDAARDAFSSGTQITYLRDGFTRGELNPIVYFDSIEVNPDGTAGETFGNEDQWIRYETSAGVHTRINDKARDIYTDKMFADLHRLIAFADSIQISDSRALRAYFSSPPHGPNGEGYTGQALDNAVDAQLAAERAQASAVLYHRFNNMLDLLQRHSLNAIAEHTRLGSRMAKFDMMHVRLEEDEVAYTELLSNTIDTDTIDTMKRKESAEAIFGFALRAIAMTTQLSLADFINR